MTEDNKNTTKLIILIAGLSTLAFFAYLIYKDYNRLTTPVQMSLSHLNHPPLEKIEKELEHLEIKLDDLTNRTKEIHQRLFHRQPTHQQLSQPERTTVSLGKSKQISQLTKMKNTNTKEMFGMM